MVNFFRCGHVRVLLSGMDLTVADGVSSQMAATAKLKKQSGVRIIPTVFDNESYNQVRFSIEIAASQYCFLLKNGHFNRTPLYHAPSVVTSPLFRSVFELFCCVRFLRSKSL